MKNLVSCLFELFVFLSLTDALPDEGKLDHNVTNQNNYFLQAKSLYKNSNIFVTVNCEDIHDANVTISLTIVLSPCWDYTDAAKKAAYIGQTGNNTIHAFLNTKTYKCNDHIVLDTVPLQEKEKSLKSSRPIYVTARDAVYVLFFLVSNVTNTDYTMTVHVEMKSSYGYLSAADWPYLPFYGCMCIFYVILGLIWLILSFMQWRDLLRVQFWIGGVILLGMLEKATFYAEYQSINSTGTRVEGAMLFAEWVSCAKRTLARILVVIISLGFGIVKPRLGASLHRVVGVGLLYFILAASESYLRVTQPKNDSSKDLLVASVPLAVLDSAICWWIFSALVNTTRTLRLRKNEVKLTLYKHFTNTLIFAVIASVIYMLYSIKTHHLVSCYVNWKNLFLDDAYWHILFSALLLVIIILWRPTNNNQRYAFVPLVESGEDEEEEQLVNDAYGVKVRIHHQRNESPKQNSVEEDLKWLEEYVKTESTLPVLDSDEEMVNTRFEVSKMQ